MWMENIYYIKITKQSKEKYPAQVSNYELKNVNFK